MPTRRHPRTRATRTRGATRTSPDAAKVAAAKPEPGGRTLHPVVVLTTLCNSLNEIVEADLKEEELPEIENLIEKALSLIEALKKRCSKK